jgi:hypothetical protein
MPKPWEMTLDEFLGRPHVEVVANEYCNPSFTTGVTKLGGKVRHGITVVPGTHGHYALAVASSGRDARLLYHNAKDEPWRIVGFYEGPTVCIHPKHQGKGLGLELILFASALRGGSAVAEYQDEMLFSEAGLGAHVKAHDMAIKRAMEAGETVPERVIEDYKDRTGNDRLGRFRL